MQHMQRVLQKVSHKQNWKLFTKFKFLTMHIEIEPLEIEPLEIGPLECSVLHAESVAKGLLHAKRLLRGNCEN